MIFSAFKRLIPHAQHTVHLAKMHFTNFIAQLFIPNHVIELECSINNLKQLQGFSTSVGTLYDYEPKKIKRFKVSYPF